MYIEINMKTEAKLVFHSEGRKELNLHQTGHNLHLYQSQTPHRIIKQFHRTWITGKEGVLWTLRAT